jgi:hypothetical protein
MKTYDGWITVSLEGFAQQNQARPKEHLVKELIQNSLDALDNSYTKSTGGLGKIELSCWANPQSAKNRIILQCKDNGKGVLDIENIRTMFWTSKKDSHLNRGRMGRGFKELLCLCHNAQVKSNGQLASFTHNTKGEKKLTISSCPLKCGTEINMEFPWELEETNRAILTHLKKFIVPKNIQLKFNNTSIESREPAHTIKCALTTESFDGQKWVKPQLATTIELYKLKDEEHEGLIYEMGVPICPIEWDSPYHVNVLQRVPMNPNRDAIMGGFAPKVHRACLPYLLEEMTPSQTRAAWVGEAALNSKSPELQRKVLNKAFGQNLARSVPGFGKFNHDADAVEIADVKIVDTKQLSGGFRDIAKAHLPTSKEIAQKAHKEILHASKENCIDIDSEKIAEQYKSIITKYGKDRINAVCKFHKFMADNMLKVIFGDKAPKCTVKTAIMAEHAEATWSDKMSVLTLALDLERIWTKPLDKQNFSLIVHETAHELAAHHGDSFADALEQCAGAACTVLISKQQEVNHLIQSMTAPNQPNQTSQTNQTIQVQ